MEPSPRGAEQQRAIEAFRHNFATSMKEAAKQAKVELYSEEVAISVRGGYMVANTLIAPPEGVPIEDADKMFFTYLSLPEDHPRAKQVPSGYYTIERMAEQKTPRAKVVNLEGQTVLELPINIRKLELAPQVWGDPPQEFFAVGQATIEQSVETLYRQTRVQDHRVHCYPLQGVWFWTWV
jgi:hypothetical protein